MTFTLAHISDIHWPHVEMPAPWQLMNKRLVGLFNWHFIRRHQHTMAMLEAIVADMKAQGADHTLLTGDLTNLILKQEVDEVLGWLNHHWTPETATIIPGNHDAYVPFVLRYGVKKWREYLNPFSHPWEKVARAQRVTDEGENINRFDDSPSPGPLLNHWGPPSPIMGEGIFPSLRRIGEISIISLNTGHPTWPFRAVGWLGKRQLQALREVLHQEGAAGQCRIIAIHHPPAHVPCPARKRLLDGPELQQVLQDEGFEFLLYGHLHEFRHTTLETRHGTGHCLSAPSASDSHIHDMKGAGYNLLHISRAADSKWQALIEMRRVGEVVNVVEAKI